jgi:hypothetical protein
MPGQPSSKRLKLNAGKINYAMRRRGLTMLISGAIMFSILVSCNGNTSLNKVSTKAQLSEETGIEIFAINMLAEATRATPQRLKTEFSVIDFPDDPNRSLQNVPNGKTVLVPGISFEASSDVAAYQLIQKLRPKLEIKGYKLFITDNDVNRGRSNISIVRCDDEFTPLVYMQTNGTNYGLNTHQLIMRLDSLNKLLDLKLIGAGFDWCRYEIRKPPANWLELAKTLYKICPDMVDQGTGDINMLVKELKETHQIYFLFD